MTVDPKDKELLDLAELSLRSSFQNNRNMPESRFQYKGYVSGVFVTLKSEGKLRGCKGCVEGNYPLYETIWDIARSSAFEDSRFSPLKEDELEGLEISISILSPMEQLYSTDSEDYPRLLQLGRDGVCLRLGEASAFFLPEVALDHGWNMETTLSQLCNKAGLEKNTWHHPDVEIYRFHTLHLH